MSRCCYGQHRYELSICAIFRDEAPYLKEWIEFHRLVGVEHFYLYNHRSKDDYQAILRPYVLSGVVEIIQVPKVANRIKIFNRLQCKCYGECLAKARGVSKWVAFIDIDEYLFPVRENSLSEVLSEYESFAGIYANWRLFGTSHVKQIPIDKLLIETLMLCSKKSFPANHYVKSIVRPERASHFSNPHHPIYYDGSFQVNTDRVPFEGPFLSSYIQSNRLQLNHYWTRDEEFFYRKKIPMQKRWGGTPNAQQILKGFNVEKNEAILRFIPLLKRQLAISG